MATGSETCAGDRLVGRLVADLTGGLSVLVTGLPGSGRSHLCRAVAQELDGLGAHVVSVRGNRLLADRPLAALSLLGLKVDDGPRPGGGSVLSGAAASFASLFDSPGSVLAVDDADGLDKVSVGVIADLRARKGVPLLLVGDYGVFQEDVVVELVAAAQPGVTVATAELPFEDVTLLTNALVDGIVGADTVSRIATLSGGLPGLVQAIVHVNRRNDRLTQQGGVWLAEGDLWDDALRFALLPFVRGLDRAGLDALVRLASAEGVTAERADELVGAEATRLLTGRGLLRRDHMTPAPGLHVFPPALAELLRRGNVATETPTDRERLSAAGRNGWPVDLTGPQAAAVADRIVAQWRSDVALHWSRWDKERVPRTAVPLLLSLLSGMTGDDYVTMVFDKTDCRGDQAGLTAFVGLVATYRALWQRDLAGALAELERHGRSHPHLATALRGDACHLIIIGDRVPEPALLELPGADESGDGEDVSMLLVARAEAMIAQGRTADAAEELALIDPQTEKATVITHTLRSLVHVLGDDVTGGVEMAVRHLRQAVEALDSRSISGHAYVAALGLSMLGRFDELASIVEVVYRLANTNLFQNRFQIGLFMLGSFVAGWEGRQDYARTLAIQASSLGAAVGPFPGMLAERELLVDSSVTADRLWDEVDDLLSRGFVASAVFLAVAAVEREGPTTRADALTRRGAACQSRVLRTLTGYVATVVSGDPDRFEATVAELRQVCGPVDATRATITWALLLRERGDLAGWLAKAEAAWLESRRVAGTCAGLFARLVEAVDLTDREIEVVGYAASGLSSPEIASAIGIATRTIETYLHSAYRKTGVSSRDELRRLAQTWLTVPVEA